MELQKQLTTMVAAVALTASAWAGAQPSRTKTPAGKPKAARLAAKKQFALNVVQTAVALPQADAQDRLRVLHAAASVVGPIRPALAKQFTREGARLEAELIASGAKPAVSILATGQTECGVAQQFVELVPEAAVARGEDSLLAALSVCPRQVQEPLRRKLEQALENKVVAPRPLLALMEMTGASSQWSQATFTKMFGSLPKGAAMAKEAPNFAAMLLRMAPKLEKEAARDAGLKFLEWLAQFEESGERNLAVNMAMGALREALGEEKLGEALRSNVMAQQIARTEGQEGGIEHPEEETVSVLEAMAAKGDQTEGLRELPASLRAKQAAAHGFATGTQGDKKMAERYFEIAFAAVDEVWAGRTPEKNAAAVVEEVSEAAAHVDAVAALQRAQKLSEPAAQAISMLAVARVVVGGQD